jgi:hypothetical protein
MASGPSILCLNRAIDGEIFQDAYLALLNSESEIYLIPKISGG